MIMTKKITMHRNTRQLFTKTSFAPDIDKDRLNTLPRAAFHGQIVLVETLAQAKQAIQKLQGEHILGIDTETKPSFVPGKKISVSLIQISTIDTCYLFRINKIGIPVALKNLFEREDILKVGLSLRDDIVRLKSLIDFEPEGFVELQQLAPAYGIRCASLQKIYAITHGRYMSKAQRMTNWEAPILTEPQQAYAALDAQACLEIYLRLMEEEHPHPAQFGFIQL